MSASEIVLPQLGETVEEALIIKWFKAAGQVVSRGETLLEAETDKITVEVPALVSGTLLEIVAPEGETVSVGAVIARINEAGSAGAAPDSASAASSTAPAASATSTTAASTTTTAAQRSQPAAPAAQTAATTATPGAPSTPRVNKLRASPAARATARQLGIDLAALAGAGSGPLGRITKADVQALSQGGARTAPPAAAATTAAGAPTPAPAAAQTPSSRQPTPSYADAVTPAAGSTYELTRIEQVSARLTARSFQEVPHFYVTLKVDVTDAVQRLRALPDHLKVSINDALVKVTALALELHPRLNSTLAENTLQLHPNINIGVITATENGVITSVVPAASTAGLTQIRTRVREVRARLQSGQAQASDVSGATFCISNMGMFGIDSFSAIILQPNVAILAVGTLKEEVLVKEGKMYLGQTMALTVSADHRALDGVAVALFLKDMEKLLQEPERWLGA